MDGSAGEVAKRRRAAPVSPAPADAPADTAHPVGTAPARRTVNLALQGGGSHGAFTWGVLDRLLEDGRLDVEGVSGTSAGAVNGALLAYGLLTGGAEGARALLHRLWRRMAKSSATGPLQPTWLDWMTGGAGRRNLDHSPIYAGLDMMVRMMSPYQFNPLGLNPMRDVLDGLIDFDVLRRSDTVRLFVSATNVNRGQLRVFKGQDLSMEALLASACVPILFQAVEIDGEPYWDGGYMGNPTLYPLLHDCAATDILVVQVTPLQRPAVPTAPSAIVDRMSEIGFNATLLRELKSLELVNRLCADHGIDPAEAGVRPVYLHLVEPGPGMADLGVSSKLNADWGFLTELRDMGRAAAGDWLSRCYDQVGRESSFAAGRAII
ncbi:patatin-like phospholipase family protein [Nitrospirillum sp. BR 11164]|uniref:patatin-like phospholipase family protein n=1 Tax=Nitrospirillum sp. BR 11164 TaxID=3104324 RepID=UPI002B00290F|nr:patatin-like phospholipase family protein [Nitrospirillum sp. BR 11164]MEA1650358.1 patatin-like phospholipase family protein [Nitrospirillum sp. BR 11164]